MNATLPEAGGAAAEPEVPGYLPVSRLAVGALVLGVCSALVLVHAVFLVVPLVAVAVAMAACADCGRAGAPKAGRLAAVAGLALAIGFGFQATAAMIVARSIAAGRAVAAAEMFLAAVREGRQADAEGMCDPDARAAVGGLTPCAGRSACRSGGAGDQPGSWRVWLVPTAAGGCRARLVLVPAVGIQRGKTVERWLVTACEVDGADVRPSAR